MKKRSELLFSLILVPIDFVMAVAGFALSYIVRLQNEVKPIAYPTSGRSFLGLIIMILPVWILIFALSGLYNLQSTRSKFTEIARIFMATASGVMFLIVVEFISPQPIFPSKGIIVYGFLFAFIFITIARLVIGSLQRLLFRYGVGRYNIFVIGNSPVARQLRDHLDKQKGYHLIKLEGSYQYMGVDWLSDIVEKNQLDEMVMAQTGLSDEKQLEIIDLAHKNQLNYRFIPGIGALFKSHFSSGAFANFPVIELDQTPLDGWGRIVKRLLDLILATFGLLLLSPILLIVALVTKLTDRGPILFRHTRVSRAGKKINVLKFRTMYCKYCGKDPIKVLSQFDNGDKMVAEFKRNQKVKNDPRVTPFGRFMRSTSIDELPQLFNVIKGDLSLVGPRPITVDELARYGNLIPKFLTIKPGVTGLWQVSGRNETGYEERVKLDIYYVENWSLWLDLIILIKTMRIIINRQGAY